MFWLVYNGIILLLIEETATNMKKLENMSLGELCQLFPIILRAHNPAYKAWYDEEERQLLKLLQSHQIQRINHIGSTAVEGLIAKPIVDLLLELPQDYDMTTVEQRLADNGWLCMQRDDGQRTLDLNKGYTPDGFAEKVFHLHIKPLGDWDELYFRDYLRDHPSVAREYEALKQGLLIQFEHDRDAYTQAKSAFILECTARARQEYGLRYAP